jgi:hypothetical protein
VKIKTKGNLPSLPRPEDTDGNSATGGSNQEGTGIWNLLKMRRKSNYTGRNSRRGKTYQDREVHCE